MKKKNPTAIWTVLFFSSLQSADIFIYDFVIIIVLMSVLLDARACLFEAKRLHENFYGDSDLVGVASYVRTYLWPFYARGARWEREKGLVPVVRACVEFYWDPSKIVFFGVYFSILT